MIRMRLSSILAAIVLAATAAGPAAVSAASEPVSLDRVMAVVNNEVITRLELEGQVRLATRELNRQGVPLPERELLERQLLERMVTTRILIQFANETGLRIEEAQVDRAVARLAEQSRMSQEEFRAALQEEGITYTRFREDVKNELVVARLREREVDARLVVTDAEVDSFLRSQQASGQNDEFNLLHILITVPEAASPEQIQSRKARAEEALARLRAGADFKQISATYSDAPNALQGGELGWRPIARLPGIFVQAVSAMKTGDVSGLLRSPNGFHILKLAEKRNNAKQIVVQQTHARHILIRMNEITAEADATRRLNEIRARVVAGADFAEMARAQSEDASSVRGGDLGWLSPGDTVPDFERAMDSLKPGEVSVPIQSPFGWHLIQVLERRTEDMTKERERQVARQSIRARKADEAFTEWVRQQRDRAYVDYRPEDR